MNTRSPRIIHGIPGPSGEPGVVLLVPPSEALDWDLRDEVASTARYWLPDRQAWWVAAPYASTAVAIAARFNGGKPPHEEHGPGAATGAEHRWRSWEWWRGLRKWLASQRRLAVRWIRGRRSAPQ